MRRAKKLAHNSMLGGWINVLVCRCGGNVWKLTCAGETESAERRDKTTLNTLFKH